MTVKVVVASPVSSPLVVAVTEYVPGGPATVNDPVRMPLAIVQEPGADTGPPVKAQEVSVE